MSEQRLDTMLDGHAWPAMPEDVRTRLHDTVQTHRTRGSRWPLGAIAAALLIGAVIGLGAGWTLAPSRATSQTIGVATPELEEHASPQRVTITQVVFDSRRSPIQRADAPARWTTIGTD